MSERRRDVLPTLPPTLRDRYDDALARLEQAGFRFAVRDIEVYVESLRVRAARAEATPRGR